MPYRCQTMTQHFYGMVKNKGIIKRRKTQSVLFNRDEPITSRRFFGLSCFRRKDGGGPGGTEGAAADAT